MHDKKPFGLDAFYLQDGKAKPVVIFIHGFNAFKDWGHFDLVAEAFANAGFTFIKFNLSHNGNTPTRPTEFVDLQAYGNDKFSTDLNDIGLVLNYLHKSDCPFKREMDLGKISLVGHSRGGALVMLKAGEDPRIKAIATWASIKSTRHFWTKANIEKVKQDGVVYYVNGRTKQKLPLYYAYYEDVLLNPERLDVEKAVRNLKIPALITHGDADESVPMAFVETLQEWKPDAEKFLVEGAAHTFGAYHPFDKDTLPDLAQKLVDKTIGFFKEKL
jgi:pimeloyl-ACP methyl ester carboxylesterase